MVPDIIDWPALELVMHVTCAYAVASMFDQVLWSSEASLTEQDAQNSVSIPGLSSSH